MLLNVADTFPIRLADGKITNLVDIERGSILDFPTTVGRLFNGANTGKQILDISSYVARRGSLGTQSAI